MTAPSSITSRNADWVRGGVRLISSTTTTWAKTGPGEKVNAWVAGFQVVVPVMSEGIRSGVPWMRPKLPADRACERAGQGRLAAAGDVVDEDVAAGEQGHGDELDGVTTPTDDALDVVDDGQGELLGAALLEVVRGVRRRQPMT